MVCAKFTSIQFQTPAKGLGTQPRELRETTALVIWSLGASLLKNDRVEDPS